MAMARRIGPVLEIVARMQNPVIVQELHGAGLEGHLQVNRRIVDQFIDPVHHLDLRGLEPRCIGEAALRLLDVVTQIDGRELAGAPV